MEKVAELRTALERLKGQQQALEAQKGAALTRLAAWSAAVYASEEAQHKIQLVARRTQEQLRYRIEEPVALALSAVFDTPYGFELRFVPRRGRTECDLVFKRNGRECTDLEFNGGGGAVDVAAFGLQIAVLALMKSRARPLLILDEPLRWLKGGKLPQRGAMMIGEIAHELGIQVLMVSHIPEQKAGADKLFNLSLSADLITRIVNGEPQAEEVPQQVIRRRRA